MTHIAALAHEYAEAALDFKGRVGHLLDLNVDLFVEIFAQLVKVFFFGHALEIGRIFRVLFANVDEGAENVLVFDLALGKLGRVLAQSLIVCVGRLIFIFVY